MAETSFSVGPLPGLDVIRSIGRGNVAEVFLAREPELKRLVALKVLHPEVASDPIGRQRFEREGLAAARLTSEGVVQVHRVGETADRRPYLVMEYVPGRNLEQRVAAEGPLPIGEVRRILGGVAEALAAVHAHGIVHRDLRPANVLEEEQTGRIVLTDFGLAALLESGEGNAAKLTATGQLLGDFRFVTPEQLRGERATGQADVYQLGVLAHFLATGQGPFGDLPMDRLLAAHLEGEPDELIGPGGAADPELAALVRRCLAKSPPRRPTAGDLVRRLTSRGSDLAATRGLDLIRRRIPHFVIPTGLVGLAFISQASDFVQNSGLPRSYYWVSVLLAAHALLASVVVSWFHGARGKQRIELLEVVLLVVITGSFLALSAWVLLG